MPKSVSLRDEIPAFEVEHLEPLIIHEPLELAAHFQHLAFSDSDSLRGGRYAISTMDVLADYQGPRSPNLDGLHAETVALFVKADKAYFATTRSYLEVESGRRSVHKQAELYINWRLGLPGYNPADVPGISVHNYGFGIDIRRAGDRAVVTALSRNGWTQTIMPREPWHWEATAAPKYAVARQRRADMQAPGSLARRWQEQWESANAKNNSRNSKVDAYNARLAVWQPQWQQWQQDADVFNRDAGAYNQRAVQWNTDRDRFNADVDRFNAEVQALRALRARIEAMPPSDERNRLIREYNSRTEAALSENSRLNNVRNDLNHRSQILSQEKAQLEQRFQVLSERKATLEAEYNALVAMRDEIDRLQQEVQSHLANAATLLDELARSLTDV